MRIVDATVLTARRARDFNRIEGVVLLDYQPAPGAPVERREVRASVPLTDRKGRAVRVRLIADAVQLVRYLPAMETASPAPAPNGGALRLVA